MHSRKLSHGELVKLADGARRLYEELVPHLLGDRYCTLLLAIEKVLRDAALAQQAQPEVPRFFAFKSDGRCEECNEQCLETCGKPDWCCANCIVGNSLKWLPRIAQQAQPVSETQQAQPGGRCGVCIEDCGVEACELTAAVYQATLQDAGFAQKYQIGMEEIMAGKGIRVPAEVAHSPCDECAEALYGTGEAKPCSGEYDDIPDRKDCLRAGEHVCGKQR